MYEVKLKTMQKVDSRKFETQQLAVDFIIKQANKHWSTVGMVYSRRADEVKSVLRSWNGRYLAMSIDVINGYDIEVKQVN